MVTVIVDDHDAAISYTGTWLALRTSGASNEYNKTSHGTNIAGSGFQLRFRGSSVAVFGTVPEYTKDSVQSSYSVDGAFAGSYSTQVGMRSVMGFYQQVFFSSGELGFGWHVVAATVTAANESYWLDYLTYEIPARANASTADTQGTSASAARVVVPSVVLPLVVVVIALSWLFRKREPFNRRGSSTVSGAACCITPYVADAAPRPVRHKPIAVPQQARLHAGDGPERLPPTIRRAVEVESRREGNSPPSYIAAF